jgi:S-layer family protein/beta-propeller repeat-containing protein
MKTKSMYVFHIVTLFSLLALCMTLFPASPAQAAGGTFAWAKRLGGTLNDDGTHIEVDSAGNVYTIGGFFGTADFDPGAGTVNLTSAGSADLFVSKLDSSGNFVWARRMGGVDFEESFDLAVDTSGNVYMTGYFLGTVDFDPGVGTTNLTSAGFADIFIAKLDSSGNFVWARRIGGVTDDLSFGLVIDAAGDVYTIGYFFGTADFDPGVGTVNLTSAGSADIFVSKLDSNGDFVWARSMGGVNSDTGNNLAMDAGGNVYTTGSFKGTVDFDPGVGTANLTSVGANDIFIAKLDSNANLIWARSLGGTSTEYSNYIGVDSLNNVYTIGGLYGTVDFDPGVGTANLTSAGDEDIFISKLNSNGDFVWARSLGGVKYDQSTGLAIDAAGNVYTTGFFQDTLDVDPGAGTANLTSAGSYDIFLSKLDSNGSFVWARQIGGADEEFSSSLAVDTASNVYTTGGFAGTADFDPGPGTVNLTSAGGDDIFIVKLQEAAIFADVALGYWARDFIERLYFVGITGGCGTNPLRYCPEGSVTRAQMAIFLLRGIHGSSYNPPAIGATTGFGDVPTTYWAAAWIKRLAGEGITLGCGNGNYCPEAPVTRAQMAIFLLRSTLGPFYDPPSVGGSTGFTDVAPTYWAAAWIKQLVAEGITAGCGSGIYCPEAPVTRAQMAVFLVRTFNLP